MSLEEKEKNLLRRYVQRILDVAGPSSVVGSVCDAKKPISRLEFLDFIHEKVDAIDVIICAVAASRLDTLTRNAKGLATCNFCTSLRSYSGCLHYV